MARQKKAKIIKQVIIGNPTDGGKCIARLEDQIAFVNQAAPGDIADIQVIKQKKGYADAIITHLHQPGTTRVQPFCEHFGVCGGCQWQHISYKTQLAAKEVLVREKLIHIAHISNPPVKPIIPAAKTQYYRNKLEFTFSNKRWLSDAAIQSNALFDRRGCGFHKPQHFDKIVDINHCYLQPDPSNAVRLAIKQYAKEQGLSFYDIRAKKGLLRNLIIRTAATGEVMVIVQFGENDQAKIDLLMAYIKTEFPAITSLQYVVNTKPNETFYDLPVHCYAGRPYIIEQINALTWQIGPKSFFQTNTDQAQILFQTVLDLADLKGHELVYDLYTGVGTIAHCLAKKAKHVVGIELVESAIADARVNATLNRLDNVSFEVGDIGNLFNEALVTHYGKPDLVVVDPPRAGMHIDVVNQLLTIGPEKIIYVSCNPATQARDLIHLQTLYRLEQAQPIDLFPHTSHVENVVLLIKK